MANEFTIDQTTRLRERERALVREGGEGLRINVQWVIDQPLKNLGKVQESTDTLLFSLIRQWDIWKESFPGKESQLAIRMIRFLEGAPPLTLKKPNRDRWTYFQKLIFWHPCTGVRFVGEKDFPSDPEIKRWYWQSIENVIHSGLDRDQAADLEPHAWKDKGDDAKLDDEAQKREDQGLRHFFDILLPQDPWTDATLDSMSIWHIEELKECSYRWLRCHVSIEDLLDDALSFTFRLVGRSLSQNKHVEAAYGLLEMWGSGNYPIGFDKDNRLIVLCA